MKERPIIMSALSVRAIFEDLKTNTRRVVKPQPKHLFNGFMYGVDGPGTCREVGADYPDAECDMRRCPYGAPGDRLWVREAFRKTYSLPELVKYRATEPENILGGEPLTPWKPSIHMPRWASRLLLEVKEVRVERLQEITNEGAKAEGADSMEFNAHGVHRGVSHRTGFEFLWDSLNEKRGFGWEANPWVWVVTFRRVK